ncbi:hypothetical protein P6709_20110, partial [Jeotgalibacillus sp. ET6]|uniref:hypothetical protein n=1 Tax=Jeotgalibacillus sp. ET6 TaxID=3037260 RepID=UPI002418B045
CVISNNITQEVDLGCGLISAWRRQKPKCRWCPKVPSEWLEIIRSRKVLIVDQEPEASFGGQKKLLKK